MTCGANHATALASARLAILHAQETSVARLDVERYVRPRGEPPPRPNLPRPHPTASVVRATPARNHSVRIDPRKCGCACGGRSMPRILCSTNAISNWRCAQSIGLDVEQVSSQRFIQPTSCPDPLCRAHHIESRAAHIESASAAALFVGVWIVARQFSYEGSRARAAAATRSSRHTRRVLETVGPGAGAHDCLLGGLCRRCRRCCCRHRNRSGNCAAASMSLTPPAIVLRDGRDREGWVLWTREGWQSGREVRRCAENQAGARKVRRGSTRGDCRLRQADKK